MHFSTVTVFLPILLALLISIPLASAQTGPRNVTSPTSQTLNAIITITPFEAGAVEDNGAIIMLDGTGWSLEYSPT